MSNIEFLHLHEDSANKWVNNLLFPKYQKEVDERQRDFLEAIKYKNNQDFVEYVEDQIKALNVKKSAYKSNAKPMEEIKDALTSNGGG